jgi:hypothetical protein
MHGDRRGGGAGETRTEEGVAQLTAEVHRSAVNTPVAGETVQRPGTGGDVTAVWQRNDTGVQRK